MATHRYPALGNIATILTGIGWLAIGTCALLVLDFAFGSSGAGLLFGPLGGGPRIISIIGSFVLGISWITAGELIQLFVDIEKNTRASATGVAPPAKRAAETAKAGGLPSEEYEPTAGPSAPTAPTKLYYYPLFGFSKAGLILVGVALVVLIIVLLI